MIEIREKMNEITKENKRHAFRILSAVYGEKETVDCVVDNTFIMLHPQSVLEGISVIKTDTEFVAWFPNDIYRTGLGNSFDEALDMLVHKPKLPVRLRRGSWCSDGTTEEP